MANKGPSPEEQLLGLIEKRDTSKAEKIKKKKALLPSFAKVGKLLPFVNRLSLAIKRKLTPAVKAFELELVNRVLVVGCILIFCYSIADFIFSKKDIEKFYKEGASVKHQKEEEKEIVKLRPFLHYLAIVQRRDIFSPVKLVKDVDIFKERRDTLQTLMSDLSLVGISWGEEPQAMIESKKAKQTYFLKAGDEIIGLKIQKILKNKVILTYQGEQQELI